MDTNKLRKLAGLPLVEEKLAASAQKIYANLMSTLGQGVLKLETYDKDAIKTAIADAYSEGYKDGYNQSPKRQ